MPRFLEDFIIPSLNEGRYKEKLRWDSVEKNAFLVYWLHKSTSSWSEEDTIVFQEWDKMKGHYKPENPNYLTESKQRFRAALYKLDSVKEEEPIPLGRKANYKKYKIVKLGKEKKQKNKINRKAVHPKQRKYEISKEVQINNESPSQLSCDSESDQNSLSVSMENFYPDINDCNFDNGEQRVFPLSTERYDASIRFLPVEEACDKPSSKNDHNSVIMRDHPLEMNDSQPYCDDDNMFNDIFHSNLIGTNWDPIIHFDTQNAYSNWSQSFLSSFVAS